MPAPLRVAVAQPTCVPGDPLSNAAHHARIVGDVTADLFVFPELSLTGYVLDAELLGTDDEVFAPIVDACSGTDKVVLVGAPLREKGGGSIAFVVVSSAGTEAVYRKMCLGVDESTHFLAGSAPGVIEVRGRRVGLGICKDTRIDEHLDATLAQHVDLYAAGLVHGPNELDELDRRARRISHLGAVPVAFASAAGDVGGAYRHTAGHSGVWSSEGTIVSRCGPDAGEFAVATLE